MTESQEALASRRLGEDPEVVFRILSSLARGRSERTMSKLLMAAAGLEAVTGPRRRTQRKDQHDNPIGAHL